MRSYAEGQSMIKNCKYKEITGRKHKLGLTLLFLSVTKV